MTQHAIPRIPDTLTVDEACEMVGSDRISRNSFYKAIRSGDVPSLRLGRRILIPRVAFLNLLTSGGESRVPA